MAGVRAVLKEWEKHLREYHSAGGCEYRTDEIKSMLLRRMLPCDGTTKRLTHREFVDGAVGTAGESYDAFRQRVIDTIAREELEVQARGGILAAQNNEEHIYKNDEEAAGDDDCKMDEEELNNVFTAIDTGLLTTEQVSVLQKHIQIKCR